jgi:hypothetical protein
MKKAFLVSVMISLATASTLLAQGTSTWVYFGPDNVLHYATDSQGNRIMDFSYAGYGGGGVTIPDVSVQVAVNPVFGDNTGNIQHAIDQVSALAPNPNGIRGAVLLQPGIYKVDGTLNITASGVVLRGSGSGTNGSVITMGASPHLLLSIQGSGSWQTVGSPAAMIDSYVPSGTMSFNVDDVSGFGVSDTILIRRPVTAAWVNFMGMDHLIRNGQPQTWLSVGSSITTDRVIAAINGNQVTLDAPLTDSFDSIYLNPPGSTIIRYTFPGRISHVGVEHLSVIAPPADVDISLPQYTALSLSAVIDAWARDIAIQDTQNSVTLSNSVKQVTLDSVSVTHTITHSGSDAPADFSISGTQVLVNRCSVIGSGVWPIVTQSRVAGPVAVLNFTASERGFSPHQRWATGLLCDGCQFPGGMSGTPGIAYSNRGTDGSGHGWDAGWGVAWNVTTPYLLVQKPPGVDNWCIGCVGTELTKSMPGGNGTLLPNGIYDSLGTPVIPSSLYLEQLRERLGDGALANIGYGWTDQDIGSPGRAGSASINAGTYSVNGGGKDIWGRIDQFNYVYQSSAGDLTITAQVSDQQNTNAWAKSGVMIRETTDPGSAYVFVVITPGNGVNMQYRASTGANAVQLAGVSGLVAPYWVQLVRSENTFRGFTSADGVNWTQVGSITVTMTSSVTAGLAVTSHRNTALNKSTFDNVNIR